MGVINSVVLVGHICKDAELKTFGNGGCVVTFTIAQNKSVKKGDEWVDEAQFFDIKFFGKGAEAVHKYLLKGKQVGIQGELDQEKWQDKETGKERSKLIIKVSELQLLGGASGGQQNEPAYKPSESSQRAANAFGGTVVRESKFQDNIPF